MMIFDNMEFHNVEEMEKCEKGYIMWRIPLGLRPFLCEKAADRSAKYATGVEIRFKMKSDRVVLKFRTEPMEEAQMACIYYGSIQGGWQNSTRMILEQETKITIERPENMEKLKKITREHGLAFEPDVVRLVLPYGMLYYIGVEGDVEPPAKEEMPEKTYLAYGSSITHGSLGFVTPYSYPFQIGQRLGCDYLNLGFAGSAMLEEEMARYLCARKDWNFASLELGVNMLGEEITLEEFENRAQKFLEIFAEDGRMVFVTDVFGNNGGGQEKAEHYRQIVQKLSAGKLIYTNGLQILNNSAFISQDMVHPSAQGQFAIAEKWGKIMENRKMESGWKI